MYCSWFHAPDLTQYPETGSCQQRRRFKSGASCSSTQALSVHNSQLYSFDLFP